eukprot:PhM_4_TR18029/c1_g1_i1/m.93039/K12310/CTBS; Di-N-acetylchitobiase
MKVTSSVSSIAIFVIIFSFVFGFAVASSPIPPTTDATACPCADVSECTAVTVEHSREIFGFYGGNETSWEKEMDWSRITILAWPPSNPQMACVAHRNKARVLLSPPSSMPLTPNATARALWISAAVKSVQDRFADGIVFDYEDPMDPTSPDVGYFTALVSETTNAMRAAVRGSKVAVAVAWSPDDIDRRGYDYVGLAVGSDYLYVMSYDTRSQITGRCIAGANAAYFVTVQGIERYLRMGVEPSKLVLGVPWYGYSYPCTEMQGSAADGGAPPLVCGIKQVPFRGVNCSDAAGAQISYADIMNEIDTYKYVVQYDSYQQAPSYAVTEVPKDPKNSINVPTPRQQWYDNPDSLKAKYTYAAQRGLRGVGPFTFSDVDPTGTRTNNPKAPAQAREMWAAFDAFLNAPK